MDTQIRLRNTVTGQECNFDSVEQANNFGRNVADPENWTEAKDEQAEEVAAADATAQAGTDAATGE